MELNRKSLQKNILYILLEENKIKLHQEKLRFHQLLENKEEYIFSKNNLHESIMDNLGDVGGNILKTLGGDIDSIKSHFIKSMLESLGVTNDKAVGIMTNIIEQLDISDLLGFMTGSYGCESLTQDIVKGLIEFSLEDGIKSIANFLDELDIPVIDGLIQQYTGGEGLLDNAEEERLVNLITDKIYPVVGEKVEDFICNLGFMGTESDAEEAVNEIYDYNIYESYQRIKFYNNRHKKLLIKQNE